MSTLFAGGCSLLEAPAPEPTPTPPPTPVPDVFDPTDFTVGPPGPPPAPTPVPLGTFRVAQVLSGELVRLQSVVPAPPAAPAAAPVKGGTPAPTPKPPVLGVPERIEVRIAGVFAPAPGQPGGAEAMRAVQNWTLGQNVTVQQDSKYLTDESGRRMVQIFFNGRRKDNPKTPQNEDNTGTVYLLNRMLIRGGLAVVDIYTPSSFDTKGWLNDEEYARSRPKPLGLWGRGIILGRRPPLPRKKILKQTIIIKKTTRPVIPPKPPAIR